MANSTEVFDAIIIGAGHNGLVAAGSLARAGKKVRCTILPGVSGLAATVCRSA